MDEKRIADIFSSSEQDSEEEGREQSTAFSITQLFIDVCPRFIAMGMTYDEYWNGSAEITVAYRKAWEIKQRNKNQELWMQGLYVVHALNATVGNMLSSKSAKLSYPSEPFPLTDKEKEEQEERARKRKFEEMKQSMIAYASMHNEKMKNKGGEEHERSND